MKPIYIPCECGTPYHCLVLTGNESQDEVEVAFVSTRNGSFWHRVKWALKHVFGREDLVFADLVIKRDNLLEGLKGE